MSETAIIVGNRLTLLLWRPEMVKRYCLFPDLNLISDLGRLFVVFLHTYSLELDS